MMLHIHIRNWQVWHGWLCLPLVQDVVWLDCVLLDQFKLKIHLQLVGCRKTYIFHENICSIAFCALNLEVFYYCKYVFISNYVLVFDN